jgi:hypothetical protein
MQFTPGTRVRFTKGPLGLMDDDSGLKFKELVVNAGDEGVVSARTTNIDGWLIVDVPAVGERFYCPVHPYMIERV